LLYKVYIEDVKVKGLKTSFCKADRRFLKAEIINEKPEKVRKRVLNGWW